MYAVKAPAIKEIKIGTHLEAASLLSLTFKIFTIIKYNNSAATTPPKTGEITQLAAIAAIVPQLTIEAPATVRPAPRIPPTMECVVDTGELKKVAKFIQRAAANNALNIRYLKSVVVTKSPGDIMPLETVLTTSPPANNAPELSHIAAITTAVPTEITFPPTAGPILLATSFAPILSAIYPPTIAAATKIKVCSLPKEIYCSTTTATNIKKIAAMPNNIKNFFCSINLPWE